MSADIKDINKALLDTLLNTDPKAQRALQRTLTRYLRLKAGLPRRTTVDTRKAIQDMLEAEPRDKKTGFIIPKGSVVRLCGKSGPLVLLLEDSTPHGCPRVRFLTGSGKGEERAATLYLHTLTHDTLHKMSRGSHNPEIRRRRQDEEGAP